MVTNSNSSPAGESSQKVLTCKDPSICCSWVVLEDPKIKRDKTYIGILNFLVFIWLRLFVFLLSGRVVMAAVSFSCCCLVVRFWFV